jgi:hypothetical protein
MSFSLFIVCVCSSHTHPTQAEKLRAARDSAVRFVVKGLPVPDDVAQQVGADATHNKLMSHLTTVVRAEGNTEITFLEPILGQLGEKKFGVVLGATFRRKDGRYSMVIPVHGTQPNGHNAYSRWVRESGRGARNLTPPDNPLFRDVIRANLARVALEGLPAQAGGAPRVVDDVCLVYDNPDPTQGPTCYKVAALVDKFLAGVVGSATVQIQAMRRVLSDPNTPRELVNVAWSFPAQVAAFQRCPEVMMMDTKQGTNILRRPLLQIAAMDSDGGNILPAQAMLRDETNKTFAFVTCVALPHLLGREALACTNVILTDECPEEIASVKLAQSPQHHVFKSSAVRAACAYHKITRGLSDNFGRGHGVSSEVYDKIRDCLHSIGTNLETRAEALQTFECLRTFASTALPAARCKTLLEYLVKLEGSLADWAFFTVIALTNFAQRTSNRVEIENAIIQGRPSGPKGVGAAKSPIATVAFTAKILGIRTANKSQQAYRKMSTNPSRKAGEETAPVELAQATSLLTHAGLDFLTGQLRAGSPGDYDVTRHSAGHYTVLKKESRRKSAKSTRHKIGPTLYRTRLVSAAVDKRKRVFLRCSCCYYQRFLIVCRHIIAVRGGKFDIFRDVHYRWFLLYASGVANGISFVRAFDEGTSTGPGLSGLPDGDVADLEEVVGRTGDVPMRAAIALPVFTLPGCTNFELMSSFDLDDDEEIALPGPSQSGSSQFSRCLALITSLGKQIATTAALPTRTNSKANFEADMADVEAYLGDLRDSIEQRHAVQPAAMSSSAAVDGFVPSHNQRTYKRGLSSGEHRAGNSNKRRRTEVVVPSLQILPFASPSGGGPTQHQRLRSASSNIAARVVGTRSNDQIFQPERKEEGKNEEIMND